MTNTTNIPANDVATLEKSLLQDKKRLTKALNTVVKRLSEHLTDPAISEARIEHLERQLYLLNKAADVHSTYRYSILERE